MRKDWIKMPMWIFCDAKLSPTEACVLALIIDKAKLKAWKCALSQEEIAEQLNISKRTVIRALGELESRELISITRTGKQSVYTVAEQARIEQTAQPPRRTERAEDAYTQRIKMLSAQAQAREEREREEKISELAKLANNFS
jgi:DNA-binding MarR family transcriptional regulator